MIENTLLPYEKVCLLPEFSVVRSRSECDTSVVDRISGLSFKLPVMPANMKCCIDTSTARKLSEDGYFYSMHRFGDTLEFVKLANAENWRFISISVGVKDDDRYVLDLIKELKLRVDCVTVDIAHGHSVLMKETLELLSDRYGDTDTIIVGGNVCTPRACIDLHTWGADWVKVGIAQGGACTTFGKTGFGTPMFTTVLECARTGIPIIADGGIKTNGDIAKAIAAGAKYVMAGSLFAACIDSPAESVYDNSWHHQKPYGGTLSDEMILELKRKYGKVIKKVYYGSASAFNKGTSHHIEGKKIELDCNDMTYERKLEEIHEDLQSSISYAGGRILADLKKSEWRIAG